MNNKTIFGVLIITYLLILPAQAKDKPEKLLGINDIIAKMQKQLELTDRQAGQIKPIIEEYIAKEKQLKLEEKRALSKVLTDQQLYTWNFLENEKPREKKKK